MATIVQSRVSDDPGAGNLVLAYSSDNTVGNLLVAVGVGLTSGKTFTLSDSQGNTYQNVASVLDNAGTAEAQLFFCINCKAGANTVTFDTTAAVAVGLVIHEFTHITTKLSQASAVGAGTLPDSGPLTGGNLLFGFAAGTATGSHSTAAGTGWTLARQTSATSTAYLTTEWRSGNPAIVNATFTDTPGKGATLSWVAEIVSFNLPPNNQLSFSTFNITPQWTSW